MNRDIPKGTCDAMGEVLHGDPHEKLRTCINFQPLSPDTSPDEATKCASCRDREPLFGLVPKMGEPFGTPAPDSLPAPADEGAREAWEREKLHTMLMYIASCASPLQWRAMSRRVEDKFERLATELAEAQRLTDQSLSALTEANDTMEMWAMKCGEAERELAEARRERTAPTSWTTDDIENYHADIMGAIARGWTTKANAKKVMDADLAEAIGVEVVCMTHAYFSMLLDERNEARGERDEARRDLLKTEIRKDTWHDRFVSVSDELTRANAVIEGVGIAMKMRLEAGYWDDIEKFFAEQVARLQAVLSDRGGE